MDIADDDVHALENLLRNFQEQLQEIAVYQADEALDKAVVEAQIEDLESRLDSRQQQNQDLFRRVKMLEEVLQMERQKRIRQMAADNEVLPGFMTPRRSRSSLPSFQDLSELLLARRAMMSSRMWLKPNCTGTIDMEHCDC
ncbi:unnamed protein product [Cladocopium goreaui]|uniref:Striatin N-terminal domain-containing protein n=1 Tax=Cladocopium goreaui TaxID=2562237 RepID=A0A9P1DDF1_9DINO|nr:unnamed protein product [Cladocopium goreaui]|mmetsp:Transcript_25085/g.54638  ORF Transcript_25085/g.54638 Transcript_25085/m.54638 type:complete len:141 (-) Transcript_25085:33-455(-)